SEAASPALSPCSHAGGPATRGAQISSHDTRGFGLEIPPPPSRHTANHERPAHRTSRSTVVAQQPCCPVRGAAPWPGYCPGAAPLRRETEDSSRGEHALPDRREAHGGP